MTNDLIAKKKFVAAFYEEFAAYHRQWLRGLVAEYKKRDIYPKTQFDIAHYYKDDEDKEAALFAALILKNNGKMQAQTTDLIRILGEHPRRFLENREFLYLSFGNLRNNTLEGCWYASYWRLARLFDISSSILRIKDYDLKDLRKLLNEDLGVKESDLQMLLFVEYMDEGIGIGLTSGKHVLCPETKSVKKTLNDFLPEYSKTYTTQEAIAMQGLEKSTDFLYASFAWEELCRKYPTVCSRHITLLHKKFDNRSLYNEKLWYKYTNTLQL